MTRAEREEKVLEAVREWLPELTTPGSTIQITALDPDESENGALFDLWKARAHVCQR